MSLISSATQGTESGVTVKSRRLKASGVIPVVVWGHPHGEVGMNAVDLSNGPISRKVADAGYYFVANDLAGTATWGNDAAQTKVGDAKTFGQGTLGGKAGRIGLLATSMNSLAILNWARANLAAVACVGLLVPVVDLAYEHDNNIGGFATEIETAYGGSAGYSSAVASHDPMQHASDYVGLPLKVWYASDDPLAITARQAAFIAATGAESVNLGAVGHTVTTVDTTQVADFFRAHLT